MFDSKPVDRFRFHAGADGGLDVGLLSPDGAPDEVGPISDFSIPEKTVSTESVEQLRDLLETPFSTCYRRTTLDRLTVRPDGRIEFDDGERVSCAQGFLESLADHIGMPLGYAYRIDFDLYRHNFEKRKRHCCKAVTVCLNRGVALNLAGADYRPARTLDIIRAIEEADTWTLRDARISDRGVEINYIEPGRSVAPELQAEVRRRERGVPARSTGHVLWSVHNRITAAAQRLDFQRRARLERLGGALLGSSARN